MADRPRVLVVTTNWPLRRRGDRTGVFVYDPVKALEDEVDFTVVMPLDAQVAARSERDGTVAVHRFGYWWPRRSQRLAHGDGIPSNLRQSRLAWVQLIGLVLATIVTTLRRSQGTDLIHAHWLPVAVLAWPAAKLRGVPLVVTLHGTDVTQFPDRIVAWSLRRVDVVVSAHDDLLAEAERLAPRTPRLRIRHLVEPQEADPEAVRAVLGDGPIVLFVARLSPERDPVTFVRAARHVLDAVPAARFAVVGEGPERPAVEAEIARLDLGDAVTVFGHRPDVWSFLRAATAFGALSDRNNAWVTAMVEAMVAGVPVVATTAGATAEALHDGEDALLVPVGNPEAVGAAFARLLTDPGLAQRIAAGARRTLEDEGFDPAHVRRQMSQLYRDLADGTLP
ncbi:MAG: glycosyltransferase [Actinobacteria bacterium]|nr:glycosyltransferase [Actinomycetota bacterium]